MHTHTHTTFSPLCFLHCLGRLLLIIYIFIRKVRNGMDRSLTSKLFTYYIILHIYYYINKYVIYKPWLVGVHTRYTTSVIFT